MSHKQQILSVFQKINKGQLRLVFPDQSTYIFSGEQEGPEVFVTIESDKFCKDFITGGFPSLFDTYKQGLWSANNLSDFLYLCLINHKYFVFKTHSFSLRKTLKKIRFGIEKVFLNTNQEIFEDKLHINMFNRYFRLLDSSDKKKPVLNLSISEDSLSKFAKRNGYLVSTKICSGTKEEKENSGKKEFEKIFFVDPLGIFEENYMDNIFSNFKLHLSSVGTGKIQLLFKSHAYYGSTSFIEHFLPKSKLLPTVSLLKKKASVYGLELTHPKFLETEYIKQIESFLSKFKNISKSYEYYLCCIFAALKCGQLNVLEANIVHLKVKDNVIDLVAI